MVHANGAAPMPPSPAMETNGVETHAHFTPTSMLITGGAGFIGSHVVHLMAERFRDCRIVVLDKLDYCASLANLSGALANPNVVWCRGDIRSKHLVDHLLRSNATDAILNFAASTHVDNSFHSSLDFTANNVVGTHVLLESAREYGGIRRFVHVSTDEVYGGESDGAGSEEAVLAPTNPYACTKAAAEHICRGYLKTFGVPIIITRGNNVYGPCQFPDKFVAKTCTLLARRRPAYIHGDGSHLRTYVYVTDMAEAFAVVLRAGKVGGVYNVGSDTELTNLAVVRACGRAFGLDEERDKYIEYVKDREMNDRRYRIDSRKLLDLGWSEKVSWEEGIRLTAAWYADEENLKRWPHYQQGLVAHPSLEGPRGEEFFQF